MLRSMESQELDTTEQLNRAELNVKKGGKKKRKKEREQKALEMS